MAKKFSARYTNDDELSRMIHAMKIARKSSGFSQEQFGKVIGVSRETVVHVEGLVECTELSLECEVLKRWFTACAPRISDIQREHLQNAISLYLFSSVISSKANKPKPNSTKLINTTIKQQKQKVA